jgi:hypothetical protein
VRSFGELASEEDVNERAVPWVRQYVLQIVRWLANVLAALGSDARTLRDEDVPHLGEYFSYFCLQPDERLRSRKSWPTP